MKVVSLFAGIGGLDLGFIKNDFDIIWANDFDKFAVKSYKENIGNHIVEGDITELYKEIPKHDILLAGFPCQPFSTLGKLKGFDDERGTLFFIIKEILKKNNTGIVVLENVKNLIYHNSGETFKRMKEELEQINYKVFYDVLNTQDYGIPQRRNRVFMVCFKKDKYPNINFKFPKKEKLNQTTFDLLDEFVPEKYFISKKMYPTIMGKGTKGYIVNPTINQEISKTLTATMHKMHRASQDNYFEDNKNYRLFDNELKTNLRKLTPNECRRLQGFPDDWSFIVSDTQSYRQFGNAVSVNVSTKIAAEIKRVLEEME